MIETFVIYLLKYKSSVLPQFKDNTLMIPNNNIWKRYAAFTIVVFSMVNIWNQARSMLMD